MKPHKKCIEESKKRCWCIADYIDETEKFKQNLPNKEELIKIAERIGNYKCLNELIKILNKRLGNE